MNKGDLLVFKEVTPSHPALPSIIALSMGKPTPEKLKQVLNSYNTPNHHLIGCFKDNKLTGVIGFEIQEAMGEIKHIAVLSEYRLQGISKGLINQVISNFHLRYIPIPDDFAGILGPRWGGIFDPGSTPRVGSLEGETGD